MEDDDFWRTLIICAGLLAGVVWLIGGFVTSVAGAWRDGEQVVTLKQWGPWVWGSASPPDGRQIYRGRALFGRLRLVRTDEGPGHLTRLGFTEDQVPLLQGQATGHLQMRLQKNTLSGEFFGRKFSFEEQNIRNVSIVPPAPRTWTRSL